MLVPVATASGRLGWLLSVDKEMAAEECSETFRDPSYRTYMSEREFGTSEARLMNATAVVLAAYGHDCGHSDRMAEFSRPIARELSLPDYVLKKPGRLTDAEF